jgi:hypothetical protein
MLTAADIARLAALGVTAEALSVMVEVMERNASVTPMSRDDERRVQSRERQRRHREKNKNKELSGETAVETPAETERDSSVTKRDTVTLQKTDHIESVSSLPLLNIGLEEGRKGNARASRFPEFWAAYPKRSGTNSRKEAEAKFNRIVARGVDPNILIAGAARYAAYCDAEGKTQTQFVQQTTTWLNAEGWNDDLHPSRPSTAHQKPARGSIRDNMEIAFGMLDARGQGFGQESGNNDPVLLPRLRQNQS